MKSLTSPALAIALLASTLPAFANVTVSNPQSGATVSTQPTFVATSTTSTCSRGVATMGIYVDNSLHFVSRGSKLNTSIPLTAGKHNVVIQEWDYCGGATKQAVALTVATQGGVFVTSPQNQSTVAPLASYIATSTSNCPTGVSSVGVSVNNQMVYKTAGSKLNTQIALPVGTNHTVVQAWDGCGGTSSAPVDVTVASDSGNILTQIQANTAWKSSGQEPPYYADCDAACTGVTWSMTHNITSPSLSGNATRLDLGGTKPYSDVLFYNQLIGAFSTQGLPDLKHQIVPNVHDFTYDADYYLTDNQHTYAMEFDINWFNNSVGITWGTMCRGDGSGNDWLIWDNVNTTWIHTGLACNPLSNAWNHVTVNATRGPNNEVIYKSIVLNGVTTILNRTYPPFTVPSNWYGVTVNYQMDGDRFQTPVTSYVDNLSLKYK